LNVGVFIISVLKSRIIAFDPEVHAYASEQKIYVSFVAVCIKFCTAFGQNVGRMQEMLH
jgi:hypothetical protein